MSLAGLTRVAPVPPAQRFTPPVPGTEYVAPPAATAPHVMVVRTPDEPKPTEPRRSPFAPLLGALLLAAAVVALIVVLVNSGAGDDDPADPADPTAPAITRPEEPPATDGTTTSDDSG